MPQRVSDKVRRTRSCGVRVRERQVYLTALSRTAPSSGPALTFSALVPDGDHRRGSFSGRVFPLWSDAEASEPNLRPALLAHLSTGHGQPVSAEDLFAYIAAVAADPAYIERFADSTAGRLAEPPRMPPDVMTYETTAQRLHVGSGLIEPVTAAVWHCEVSGKQVLVQWFSYRRKTRECPIIGDRRPPSPLGDIQPESWPAEYTTELLNLLNVLGLLVDLEPAAATLRERICAGPLLDAVAMQAQGLFTDAPVGPSERKRKARPSPRTPDPRLRQFDGF